jgi:yecA family protein
VTDVFAYAELDEILRGAGRTGAIGMSAIDGLIAALVAAPSFVHPEEWIPLIFGGRQPLHENSPELHAVKTIFNRYNEVSETLADGPPAYRPIFMVDDDGSIIARDWAVGFALGIGLRSKEWGECILLTEHRQALVPILVYCEALAGHAGRGKAPAASYRPRRDRPCRRRRPRYLQPLSRRRSAPATRQTTPRQQHAPVAPAGASRAVKPPKRC